MLDASDLVGSIVCSRVMEKVKVAWVESDVKRASRNAPLVRDSAKAASANFVSSSSEMLSGGDFV
jgi:hypothetical protein